MGTSKSYSGSGGKAGKVIRHDVGEWLDSLSPAPPASPGSGTGEDHAGDGSPAQEQQPLEIPLQNVVNLLRPRSRSRSGGGDGPGGGGSGGSGGSTRSSGGPRRSAARSAATAGRAAAAAYAFRVGDTATLERLGLNYAELVALGNPILVVRRIVEVVCGPRSNSSIEETEQRLVAAEVAEWVVSQQGEGYEPTPEDIAKHAIADIIADTMLTEVGELLSKHESSMLAEGEIREAAENWVETRATVSIEGATEEDFSTAIENGIESLRKIIRGGS